MTPRWALIGLAFLLAGCVGSPGGSLTQNPGSETQAGNGILEGSVVSEDFVPIAAARVTIVGTDRAAETSYNGHFRFTDLGPGTYDVHVEAVGWAFATVQGVVRPDYATRLTIFLDPLITRSPYQTLESVNGDLTCADLEAGSPESLTCDLTLYDTAFQPEWAGELIEVNWGPSGMSSSGLAQLTAEHTGEDGTRTVYADIVAERPGRMMLYPSTVHSEIGGKDATPSAGEIAPLSIGIRKDPTRPVPELGAAATIQQHYEIYITTFHNVVPEDVDDYSALPGSG